MLQLLPWVCVVILTYVIVDWYRRQPRIGGLKSRYVLITGCDTGFGNLLARRLDKMGCHVFAACLTEGGQSELRESSSNKLKTVSLDVTDPDSVRRAFDFVQTILPNSEGLWALVNNAGVFGVSAGPLEWLNKEDFRKTLEVNTLGTIDVTLTFLPLLKKCGGRIVNMSSVAGRVASARNIPYTISKFGVEAFSDGLRQHLKLFEYGVSVHVIEPGAFRTPIMETSRFQTVFEQTWKRLPQHTRDEYSENFFREYCQTNCETMEAMASPKVDKVVGAYVHALTAKFPRLRYTVGYDAPLVVLMSYLPSSFHDWLVLNVTPRIRPAFMKN